MTRSLGHLMPGRTPQARSTASHKATADQAVSILSSSTVQRGCMRRERYSPFPAGERKERPRRPRPPVWQSAMMARPFSTWPMDWRLISLFVESRLSKYRTFRPICRVPRRDRVSGSMTSAFRTRW